MKPKLIKGGQSFNSGGEIGFVNGFNFKGVKRFYIIESYFLLGIRGWHGHKKEAKYVYVSQGAATIVAINMKTGKGEVFTLSENEPAVFYIPPGYYNNARFLKPNTKIIYFSTATLEESKKDDYRQPSSMWLEVWNLPE